ncbi:hypothetical protein [Stappia indica]|uniref:hypothetical protein n=1 Tax=Stappia indica TaxID=538381 RepID=UPI001112AC34|nr:hypothetical protein [Stappia indica]
MGERLDRRQPPNEARGHGLCGRIAAASNQSLEKGLDREGKIGQRYGRPTGNEVVASDHLCSIIAENAGPRVLMAVKNEEHADDGISRSVGEVV